MDQNEAPKRTNFIRQIIDEDLSAGKNEGRVATRFPPEPNGYLHVGHAKSICLNFGIAEDYPNASCNLRFDDTNPEKESQEYVSAIKEDVEWLGYEWAGDTRYASDYFAQLYELAVALIKDEKAFVCSLNAEQMREHRGTLTEPGIPSPDRDRSIEENLDLFQRMRAGEFADGELSLRAKIDMASPNLNMRDPVIYRIRRETHHQTGDEWCIYPMYDFTHCLSDALEGITHSLCTLEFEDHRPLYDWFVDNCPVPHKPHQYEFARLNLTHTMTSKRKLKALVDEGIVSGWDDPRMPTLQGMRRRGLTPTAIRNFCERIGVTKSDSLVEIDMLYHAQREDLEVNAPRAMCVLDPLKVTITNYPEGQIEQLSAPAHPADSTMGTRNLPFGRELYIEQDDFMEDAPKKFFRLTPGKEVRLRNAYVIRCDEAIKNPDGSIKELLCSYDPDTLGKNPEGRKVKGVIHWVSSTESAEVEVRLYEELFDAESPDAENYLEHLNRDSVTVLPKCYAEPDLAQAAPENRYQFERVGYFCADRYDSAPGKPVFNRVIGLKDSWAKIKKKET